MIVAKTFKSGITMTQWLSDSKNVEKLKKKYPPSKYKADLNLIDKQVEIYEKQYMVNKKDQTTYKIMKTFTPSFIPSNVWFIR